MMNTIILIAGDLFVTIFQGFYMGVGIRQSAGTVNILAMTIPTLVCWLALSAAFGIYRDIPNHEERAAAIPKNETNRRGFPAFWRSLRNLANLIGKSLESQRFFAVSAVFSGTTLFAVLYQTWYWNAILKLSYPFSIRFAFYFASIGIYLMIFWRGIWTLFVAVRVVARKFIWMRAACYLVTATIVLFQIPALILTVEYAPRRFTLEKIETVPDRTAIVFGAGVYPNGEASGVLRDRVLTAIALFKAKKIDTILLSGDNSDLSRNEVDVMAELTLKNGIPEKAILRDPDGLSTIETCRNAAEKFGIHAGALITQDFHTARALYVCDQYTVNAVSVAADRASYNMYGWALWTVRDWMGLTLSWLHFNQK